MNEKRRYKRAAVKRVLVIESIKNLKSIQTSMKARTQSSAAMTGAKPLIKSLKKVGSQSTVLSNLTRVSV